MVQFNHSSRELTIKVVYYGPGLSGKTTNLQMLHARLAEPSRGRLLTVDTSDDRTLFFDMMPLFFQAKGGLKVKLKLFTVPGQVIHGATRRVVLQGADGVVFVADGRRAATEDNKSYWKDLMENLRDNGVARGDVPVVIQYNKLDMPGARTREEIDETRRRGQEPVFGAIAIQDQGVVETLHGLMQLSFRSLDARLELQKKFGLFERDFLGQLFGQMNLKGTELETVYRVAAHA